jgi:predicted 2-oxoglutarate/Fe(II)-dependent dioxygenase YbiX
MIIQLENAVGGEDCHRLMELYDHNLSLSHDQYEHLLQEGGHAGDPILFWHQIEDVTDAAQIVRRVVNDCSRKIIASFGLTDPLYPETVILTRFGPGAHHPPHADNSRQDEHGNWVPNHSPRRDVSAICYLNDDFEGGELVFQDPALTVKPRAGLLVAFPGDSNHVHGVSRVRTGHRYAMPLFFTKEEEFGIQGF